MTHRKPHLLWILPAGLYLAWLIASLQTVPFHPDEATWIFMSRDLDRLITAGPGAICWRPDGAADPLQIERERASALPRFLIGASRSIAGAPPTGADWDWSAGWEENDRSGAIPSEELLFLARLPGALLLFLATLCLARIGWRLAGVPGAVSAALFFGLNSQILLHGRRAMSESALLFGMLLAILIALERQASPGSVRRSIFLSILAGGALAVAASAKLSGLLVIPAVAAAFLWPDACPRMGRVILRGIIRVGILFAAFAVLFFLVNPTYLCHPMEAAQAVLLARQTLFADQIQALRAAAPGQVLDSPGLRVIALLFQPFFAPPAFWDIPNYAAQTHAAEQAYAANPLNMLTGGGLINGLWLLLTLTGLAVGVRRLADPVRRRFWILFWIWMFSMTGGILAGVPILWQRFYQILIPPLAIVAGAAVGAGVKFLHSKRQKKPAA